jgi:hypothetical protein
MVDRYLSAILGVAFVLLGEGKESMSDKMQRDDWEKRELDWNYCSQHGVKYPTGNECPRCRSEREAEERKKSA